MSHLLHKVFADAQTSLLFFCKPSYDWVHNPLLCTTSWRASWLFNILMKAMHSGGKLQQRPGKDLQNTLSAQDSPSQQCISQLHSLWGSLEWLPCVVSLSLLIFSFLSCGCMIETWNYLLTFYLFTDSTILSSINVIEPWRFLGEEVERKWYAVLS